MREAIEAEYQRWVKTKEFFNLDCYYCIYERSCDKAHTWNTGEKYCKEFRP